MSVESQLTSPIHVFLLPSLKTVDSESHNLRYLLQEKDWAIKNLAFHVSPDELKQIHAVGQTMMQSAVTLRSVYENQLPPPSDYAKQQCHQKDAHVSELPPLTG